MRTLPPARACLGCRGTRRSSLPEIGNPNCLLTISAAGGTVSRTSSTKSNLPGELAPESWGTGSSYQRTCHGGAKGEFILICGNRSYGETSGPVTGESIKGGSRARRCYRDQRRNRRKLVQYRDDYRPGRGDGKRFSNKESPVQRTGDSLLVRVDGEGNRNWFGSFRRWKL